jgi:hypothetical protein
MATNFEAADAGRVFARRARETGIQLVAHDSGDLRYRRQLPDHDIDCWMGLFKRANPGPQQPRAGHPGHETELKAAQLAASGLLGIGRCPFHMPQSLARVRQKALACLGDDNLGVALSHQELGTELPFKFLDLMRERRRRDAEPLGGAGEMLLLGDCNEIVEQPVLNVAHRLVPIG